MEPSKPATVKPLLLSSSFTLHTTIPLWPMPLTASTSSSNESGHPPLSPETGERFAAYLALLQKWNARTNLTAIRDEEGILSRHFLESILCAHALPAGIQTLLDFGSGAGFPGIPIALMRSNTSNPRRIPKQKSRLPPRSRPHPQPHHKSPLRPRRRLARKIRLRHPPRRRQHASRHPRRHPAPRPQRLASHP